MQWGDVVAAASGVIVAEATWQIIRVYVQPLKRSRQKMTVVMRGRKSITLDATDASQAERIIQEFLARHSEETQGPDR